MTKGTLEKAKACLFETACKASIGERKAKDMEEDNALISRYNDIYLRTILTINLIFGLDVKANPSFLAHSYMAYISDKTSGEILYRFYE